MSSLWNILFALQLRIEDGLEAVGAIARNTSALPRCYSLEENLSRLKLPSRKIKAVSEAVSLAGHGFSNDYQKLHMLIIDADSEDPRYVVCPAKYKLNFQQLREFISVTN